MPFRRWGKNIPSVLLNRNGRENRRSLHSRARSIKAFEPGARPLQPGIPARSSGNIRQTSFHRESRTCSALARKFQQKTGSDWVLAETGMAGPLSPERRSRKNGVSFLALAGKNPVDQESFMKTIKIEANPFFSKKEHQLEFSVEALKWLLIQLELKNHDKNEDHLKNILHLNSNNLSIS